MRGRIRCFIAAEPSSAVRTRFEREIGYLQLAGAKVKWVKPDNLHVTVRFLGDLEPDEIIPVCEVLEEVCLEAPAHRLELSGVSTLPHGKSPRAVVAGIGGEVQALQQVFEALQTGLGEIGIKPERRAFLPHITLGRVKGEVNEDLLERIASAQGRNFGVLDVKQLHLMMSDRVREGTLYTPMKSYRLLG